MPPEDTKILQFNQYHKSGKALSIIYADLEFLLEKTDECKTNSANLFTPKLGEHISSGFSIFITSSFKGIENKHDLYRSKSCMKHFAKFCERTQWKKLNF